MTTATDEERTDHPPATDDEATPTGATEADAADAADAAVSGTATTSAEDVVGDDGAGDDSAGGDSVHEADTASGRHRVWLVVAAGVLMIGLMVAATWLVILQQTASARDADRAAAVAAARQTVATMTTTDPARAQESFQHLTEMATGPFGQQLQAQSETFVRVVQGAAVTSRSEITESALVSGDDRRATVLVVANSVVQNAQAPRGEPRQYRMKLELDKQGDRWLVSNLEFVA